MVENGKAGFEVKDGALVVIDDEGERFLREEILNGFFYSSLKPIL